MTNPSNPKSSDVSNSSAYGTANYPFLEGNPFTATLWAGMEGFHMTVNGRHETSFAYREVSVGSFSQITELYCLLELLHEFYG